MRHVCSGGFGSDIKPLVIGSVRVGKKKGIPGVYLCNHILDQSPNVTSGRNRVLLGEGMNFYTDIAKMKEREIG